MEPTHSALGLPVVREVIISFLLFLLLVFENVETGSKGAERGRRSAEAVTLGEKREKTRTSISQRKSR